MTESTNWELTLTRVFDAPRERVFKAWIDPQLLARWWGPRGFSTPVAELDVQPGGKLNIVMEDSEGLIEKGSRYPMEGVFREIVEPQRLVYEASPLMNGKPFMDTLMTVTFEEQDGKTKLTLHILVTNITPEAAGPLSGMEMGWNQSFDKLVEFLGKK
jgi:uncharacterized protein YndB with AHSA1/START domain